MGLDIYVGTLTRYITGDWETIVQRLTREQGIPLTVLREPPPPDAVTDPDAIADRIAEWKLDLMTQMREQAGVEIDWSESADEPYFTNKPGHEGRAGLCLLAAYTLYPSVPRPRVIPDNWPEDQVFRAYLGREKAGIGALFNRKLGPPAEGRIFSHITDLDMWIPGDFDGVMEVGLFADGPTRIGSTTELHRQLQELNARTYRADVETMNAWQREDLDDSFDQEARRGLAIYTELAGQAVEHRLPMKLDY